MPSVTTSITSSDMMRKASLGKSSQPLDDIGTEKKSATASRKSSTLSASLEASLPSGNPSKLVSSSGDGKLSEAPSPDLPLSAPDHDDASVVDGSERGVSLEGVGRKPSATPIEHVLPETPLDAAASGFPFSVTPKTLPVATLSDSDGSDHANDDDDDDDC